jgi:serine protease Do
MNRGNSGGPTFDVNGNVIGVNTAIFSPSGGSVGIGFDIPADAVKKPMSYLMRRGEITESSGRTGVMGFPGLRMTSITAI